MDEEPRQLPSKAETGTHFAWLRTRLSAERTLTSGTRAVTALIGFGFTIVQFFEKLGGMTGVVDAQRPFAPRYLGLALIGAGVVQLAVFLAQYRGILRHLWGEDYRVVAGVQVAPFGTPSTWVALLVVLIGVFAFVSVLVRAV